MMMAVEAEEKTLKERIRHGMDIHRRRVDALVVIERDGRRGGLLVHCDGACSTSHTTVRTGDVKVDMVCACRSRRKRDVSGSVGVAFGSRDCPQVLVGTTRVAVQLHLLAQTAGGVARDAGCRGVEKSDI